MMALEDAYIGAAKIVGPEQAEYLDVAVEMERLRLSWRPEQVRVVLLAESHVWTSRDELRRRVKQPNGKETGLPDSGSGRAIRRWMASGPHSD